MIRRLPSALLLVVCLIAAATAQDAALVSGPQKGKVMPGPCEVFNLTGDKHKGRFHCLVCEYGLDPVVMIFTQEPKVGEDDLLNSLVNRLDGCIMRNGDVHPHAFLVVLSSRFRNSANAGFWSRHLAGREKISKETLVRTKFLEEMEARAAALEKSAVVLTCSVPEAPQSYNLNPRAQTTVIFYRNFKVLESYAFEPGKMAQADVDRIIGDVEKELKKRPNKK